MKVLILTPYLPHRRVGHGGGTAVRDLVAWLAKKHEVRVAALVRPGEGTLLGEVEELGVSVAPVPFLDNRAEGLDRLALMAGRTASWFRSLRSGYPWFVEKYWSPELSRKVLAVAEEFSPDAVQVEYLQLALLGRDLQRWRNQRTESPVRLVLNSHELGSVPRERRAARTANPLAAAAARHEARAWRNFQVDASGWFDRTLCVTPEDQYLYSKMGGRNLVTVPLGMDLDHLRPDWSPADTAPRFLFVGSFNHRPNRLAAAFLVDTVWPDLSSAFPRSRLILAGRGSRAFLRRRAGLASWKDRGVDALGFVDDLTALFRECHLFVAPLPEGGGIKIKILEAMARGIPVVTTPVGAEGICTPGDEAMVIAPCDDQFAPACLEAVRNPEAGRDRARRARKLMEDRFSWAGITARLTAIYAGEQDDPEVKV
jgi:glycosyltransferase involved in cell wall biosynthesis